MKRVSKEETINKIKNRFNGYCAYSGKPLDDNWEIDYLFPLSDKIWGRNMAALLGINFKKDSIYNKVPCCSIVRYFKVGSNTTQFKNFLLQVHLEAFKDPNNLQKDIVRKEKLKELCALFDIEQDKPFCGKFYYEKI